MANELPWKIGVAAAEVPGQGEFLGPVDCAWKLEGFHRIAAPMSHTGSDCHYMGSAGD